MAGHRSPARLGQSKTTWLKSRHETCRIHVFSYFGMTMNIYEKKLLRSSFCILFYYIYSSFITQQSAGFSFKFCLPRAVFLDKFHPHNAAMHAASQRCVSATARRPCPTARSCARPPARDKWPRSEGDEFQAASTRFACSIGAAPVPFFQSLSQSHLDFPVGLRRIVSGRRAA